MSANFQPKPDDAQEVFTSNQVGPLTQVDTYTIDLNMVPVGATINSVTVFTRAEKIGVASCSVKGVLKIGGLNYPSALANLTAVFVTRAHIYLTNPATLLPWVPADLIGLLAGVSLTTANGGNTVAECSWVYVVVDYSLGSDAKAFIGAGFYFTLPP